MLKLSIIIISLLLISVTSKYVEKIVPVKALDLPTQTLFLSKFDIGIGKGLIRVQMKQLHRVREVQFPQGMSLGILPYTKYNEFKKLQSCVQKQTVYQYTYQMKWDDYINSRYNIIIEQNNTQQIWYVYLFNCQISNDKLKQHSESIEFKIKFYNNDSHFGQDNKIFYPYFLLVAIWFFILIKYVIPIFKSFTERRPDTTRIIVYSGLIILGIAYLYKLLYVFVYWHDGSGITFLNVLYIILKNVTEGIIVTVIISISWGWSIVHLRHDQTYIVTGTIGALINIMALILVSIQQQQQEIHHTYDGMTGFIVFIIRIGLFFIFIVGILRSVASSAGRIRDFMKKFGIIGSLYLLSWPVALIFCQLFLPAYMHLQVINFIQQGTHMMTVAYICQMLSFPQSSYRKISMKQQDNPMGKL